MDFTGISLNEVRKDPALLAGFLDLYKREFGDSVCGGCPGQLERAFVKYQRKQYLSSTKIQVMSNSKYKLKNGSIRQHNGDTISDHNITDAKVIDLVTRHPGMADKFLMADGSPFKLEVLEVEAPELEVDATAGAIKAAKDLGIDLSKVVGTGKDGKIVKADVVNHV